MKWKVDGEMEVRGENGFYCLKISIFSSISCADLNFVIFPKH